MQHDSSDTRGLREARKLARIAENERRQVIVNLLSSPQGRAYMHGRLVRAHVFSSSFADSPYRTAFCEGERNVGLQDLADITHYAPDQYIRMMREATEKETLDGRRIASDLDRASDPDRAPDIASGDDPFNDDGATGDDGASDHN